MPKIEVDYKSLCAYLGQTYSMDELEAIFPAGKAELDEKLNADGIIKVELNDTNRPDLWTTQGVARMFKLHAGQKVPAYDFMSRPGAEKDAGQRLVEVDAALRDIRPFIAAFVAEGKAIDGVLLKDLIQAQEKLCWNYGQKRKSIAMGIYRSDLITFPVRYRGVDPDKTAFVPLGMDEKLNLRQIIVRHPKGQEFGHIVAGKPVFPLLEDARGQVLSFPPVINSHDLGAVQVGDSKVFVELTGTDLPSLLLAANIMACDMADAGFTILPVLIKYPTKTILGQDMVTPRYFQQPLASDLPFIRKLLGENLSAEQILTALKKMGNCVSLLGDKVTLQPAEYRNDFLHPVDIVEDVMIGRGLDSFEPELPKAFTVGRLHPNELMARRAKSLMVGLGYQEMIFNYLGSARDFIHRMNPDLAVQQAAINKEAQAAQKAGATAVSVRTLATVFGNPGLVQVSNPMSENFEYVRNSILPYLLGAESVSANAPYPHQIFEVGKTACMDKSENYLSRTDNSLGFLNVQAQADFNLINAQVQAIMHFLSVEYQLRESADVRFLPGRRADILVKGQAIGVFGELHPAVLENWGITVPCAAAEIALNQI